MDCASLSLYIMYDGNATYIILDTKDLPQPTTGLCRLTHFKNHA